jgi:hypothetical protein
MRLGEILHLGQAGQTIRLLVTEVAACPAHS